MKLVWTCIRIWDSRTEAGGGGFVCFIFRQRLEYMQKQGTNVKQWREKNDQSQKSNSTHRYLLRFNRLLESVKRKNVSLNYRIYPEAIQNGTRCRDTNNNPLQGAGVSGSEPSQWSLWDGLEGKKNVKDTIFVMLNIVFFLCLCYDNGEALKSERSTVPSRRHVTHHVSQAASVRDQHVMLLQY